MRKHDRPHQSEPGPGAAGGGDRGPGAGVNPGNSQDLTNRGNPQDLKR
jgi:hypothetical protein